MPTLEDYRKFKAVLDHRGVNAAAAALNASPGAVSTALHKVERELMMRLVDRKTWLPTPDGKHVYEVAAVSVAMLDGLQARAHADRGFRFRLAASAYVMEHYISYVVNAIREYGGPVHYHLMRCSYPDIPRLLEEDKVDLAVGPLTPDLPASLTYVGLVVLTPFLMLPATPAYARIRSFAQLSRAGLITHPLLIPPEGALSAVFDHFLRVRQITWESRQLSDEVAWIPRLVQLGEGIGLAWDLPSMLQWPGTRPLRLPGIPGTEFGLLSHKVRSQSAAPFRHGMAKAAHANFSIGKNGKVVAEHTGTKGRGPSGK